MGIQFLNNFLSLACVIFHLSLKVETLEKKISPAEETEGYV